MKTFIRFIQEEVELEEANQVKMSALKLGDTVKLNKRFGGKQGTVKEVHPNGATVHVSGTETPVFAHHSNFTKINVQKEEADLEESSKEYYTVHRAASLTSARMKAGVPGEQPTYHRSEEEAIGHLNKKYKKVRDGVWKDSKDQFFFHKKNSPMKEEVEQIDELSNTTLQRYKSKASKIIDTSDNDSEVKKRGKGYAAASKKLTDRILKNEEVELEESPNRDYIKTVLSRHLNSNRVPHKVSSTVGYDRFHVGPKTYISHDGQDLSVHHNGKEVHHFPSPKLDYKKAAAAAQKLTEANLEEESNLRITKIYNKFPKKATYAVHSLDRKYFKEFDNKEDANKHLESKKS